MTLMTHTRIPGIRFGFIGQRSRNLCRLTLTAHETYVVMERTPLPATEVGVINDATFTQFSEDEVFLYLRSLEYVSVIVTSAELWK